MDEGRYRRQRLFPCQAVLYRSPRRETLNHQHMVYQYRCPKEVIEVGEVGMIECQ